jgi:hypothetical protein
MILHRVPLNFNFNYNGQKVSVEGLNFWCFSYLLQDGSCTCKTGYYGDQCENKCKKGFYGPGCKKRCACSSLTRCDHVTGQCIRDCQPGWTGDRCDQRKLTNQIVSFFLGYGNWPISGSVTNEHLLNSLVILMSYHMMNLLLYYMHLCKKKFYRSTKWDLILSIAVSVLVTEPYRCAPAEGE